jgi:peroxiredoxin
VGRILETTQADRDPAGAEAVAIDRVQVEELQKVLARCGLSDVELEGRYSVVFVYPGIGAGDRHPELAGCTAELCTFADETTEFLKHGIQLAGLSTQPTEPPGDFLGSFPFPIGRLPRDFSSPLIELVTKDDEAYATRRSFVVFPDGTGMQITNIKDPVGHVTKCFQTAIERRLAEYRAEAVSFFQREGRTVTSSMTHSGFLANGADSVSISTVDFQARLVAKMASPDIIAQEAGYMDRINRALQDEGKAPLFPAVIALRPDQRPAYYLMEAANPLSLDHLLFQNEAMTDLRGDRLHLMTGAMTKLSNLYEMTLRAEEPPVARYHYLGRFEAIVKRRDFQDTFEFMLGSSASLDEMLSTQFVLDGDFVCRPFNDQLGLLRANLERLAQPVGAYLHGDVHLKNMLVAENGRDVVFVDPRIVWDGNDVGDPGFGDPLYDYGTLLHSLHLTSAILRAIEAEETAALMNVEEDEVDGVASLLVWPGLLRMTGSKTVDWFTDWLQRSVPAEVLGDHWRPRLHVNVANALFGWLKYARAVKTRHAWLALFAGVVYHLEIAARYLEDATEEGTR